MKKDPAFLFYTSDFLTGTMFMTNEQVGIYTRLLCAQHQHNGMIDKDSFNSMVGSNLLIRNKFIETEIGFFNEKMAIVMDERNKKSNNLSSAAKEIWEKRKQENTIVLQLHNNTTKKVKKNDTIVIQTEDVNKDIIINKDKIENKSEFEKKLDQFYNFRKELKKPILKASEQSFLNKLMKLSNNDESIAVLILDQSIANGWQGVFELKQENNFKSKNNGQNNQNRSEIEQLKFASITELNK